MRSVLTMECFYGCRVEDVERMQSLKDTESQLVDGVLAWFESLSLLALSSVTCTQEA